MASVAAITSSYFSARKRSGSLPGRLARAAAGPKSRGGHVEDEECGRPAGRARTASERDQDGARTRLPRSGRSGNDRISWASRLHVKKKGRSISRVLSRTTISLGAAVSRALVQPTRRVPDAWRPAGEQPPAAWLCSERGFPCPSRCREGGGLLPRLFTLPSRSRLPKGVGRSALTRPERPDEGVCFLWHSLSSHAEPGLACESRALPGVPLCGARTFLSRAHPARDTRASGGLICPHTLSAVADIV